MKILLTKNYKNAEAVFVHMDKVVLIEIEKDCDIDNCTVSIYGENEILLAKNEGFPNYQYALDAVKKVYERFARGEERVELK